MSRFTALFDACVLYPAPVRDILLELATTGIFRARWSAMIHEEWMRNLSANRSDLMPAQIERTRDLMDKAVPDALVTGYEALINGLKLPDPDDRYVLAAAIAGHADVIVTTNLKDFPADILAAHDLEAQHPDTFLIHQRSLNEQLFLECIRKIRRRLQKPPYDPDQYLEMLEKSGLVLIAAELAKTKKLL